MPRVTRRRIVGGTVGLGVGALVGGGLSGGAGAGAQDATPAASPVPPPPEGAIGYVSLRIHELPTADARPEVHDTVLAEFVPAIQGQPWYRGYLLGDVTTESNISLSVSIFGSEADSAAFDALSQQFISGLNPALAPERSEREAGALFLAAAPASPAATPVAATPAASPGATPAGATAPPGFITLHLFTGPSFSMPQDIVARTEADLLPILAGLPGLHGFLWFLVDDGFASITLYEEEEVATEAAAFERGWTQINAPGYDSALPRLVTAAAAFADLPILTAMSG